MKTYSVKRMLLIPLVLLFVFSIDSGFAQTTISIPQEGRFERDCKEGHFLTGYGLLGPRCLSIETEGTLLDEVECEGRRSILSINKEGELVCVRGPNDPGVPDVANPDISSLCASSGGIVFFNEKENRFECDYECNGNGGFLYYTKENGWQCVEFGGVCTTGSFLTFKRGSGGELLVECATPPSIPTCATTIIENGKWKCVECDGDEEQWVRVNNKWQCQKKREVDITPPPIHGLCNEAIQNGCRRGIADKDAETDTGTKYKWICKGINDGDDSRVCSLSKKIHGQCNNAEKNGCNKGTANENVEPDTSTEHRWICEGINDGDDSNTCSRLKEVDGQCNIECTPPPITGGDDTAKVFDELNGAFGITTTAIKREHYALVAADRDNGLQIIGITDPENPTATSSVRGGENGFDTLRRPTDITTTTIGNSHYALVAVWDDDGVQIIDITDPENPTAVSSVTDGVVFDTLHNPWGITTTTIGGRHFALVAAWSDDGVQIIDITKPRNPTAASSVRDDVNGFDTLNGARRITTTIIDGNHYALVTAEWDDGVQIIDITNPKNPTAASSVRNGVNGFDTLDGAIDITTTIIDGDHYALVTAHHGDDGVQIIDITDPEDPTAVSSVRDGVNGFDTLNGVRRITTTIIDGDHYALVTAFNDHGVQIIDITVPENPTAASSVTDGVNGFDTLDRATDITTIIIGENHYALVAAYRDHGVQIIDITKPKNPTAASSVRDYVPPQNDN